MSPDAMTSGWYYAKAGAPVGHEIGPLSWQELYLLAQDGELTRTDLVWNPKLPRGVTAGQVPGLFPSQMVPGPPAKDVAPPVQIQPAAAEPMDTPTETAPQAATAPLPVQTAAAETTAQAPAVETAPVALSDADSAIADRPGPAAEPPEAAPQAGSVGDKTAASPKKKDHANLPWLVVLLALAIAAAGLATYFLYLRDLWT